MEKAASKSPQITGTLNIVLRHGKGLKGQDAAAVNGSPAPLLVDPCCVHMYR